MISFLKNKYYWFKINQKLKFFLKKTNDSKILIFGFPKSGNTWLRFLVYNYLNLLINPSQDKTISFEMLNKLQNNVMDRGTTFLNQKGFPLIYRTHKIYKKPYDLFDKKIFIHRNPLDTLISSYYFYKNRQIPFSDEPKSIREKLHEIDYYVLYKIDEWINYYNTSIKHADFIINYSNLKNDCENQLSQLVKFLELNLDQSIIKKSIKMSSFENIKKMGEEKHQQYGNGPSDGSFLGRFTRSGEEGQFYNELRSKTIEDIQKKFSEFHKLYHIKIEN